MITVLHFGDPHREKLDAIQSQIAELVAKRKAITVADLAVEDLQASCSEAVHSVTESAAGVSMLSRLRYLAQPGRPSPLIEQGDRGQDLGALIVALLGERTIAHSLFDYASTREGYSPGLPAAQRATRVSELDEQIRDLSVAEEIEARKLEVAGGVFVMRRPLAALDIDAILKAWDQVPGTSTGANNVGAV